MLALHGKLNILVNGIQAHFEADERSMRLDLEDPVAFLRASQLFHTSSLGVLRLLAEELARNGLTLTIVSKGKTLVVMGHEIRGGIASSLLGVPHLEIKGSGLLGRIKG